MPYYSELGIYTPSSSYTSPLLKGPYSSHSSILASNILPPSSKQFNRSNFRGFKPHLMTISETSNATLPVRRINSPKVLYHSSPRVRVQRPVKINTADIDVSLNRYQKYSPQSNSPRKTPESKSPSPQKELKAPVEAKEAKPNTTIRRDRATIRLQTIHKDALEKEIGDIKSWRDNFKPEELATEAKRRKKTPGEILKEKFLIRSKSKDNVPQLESPKLPRKLSIKKSPSFKDICKEITSDQVLDDLNPGQPVEIRRRQSRQLSHDDIIKELHRSSSTLSVEEVQILDALLQAENEVGLYDVPPVIEEHPKSVRKKKAVKKKSSEKLDVEEKKAEKSENGTTDPVISTQLNELPAKRRSILKKNYRKSSSEISIPDTTISHSRLRKDSSLKDMVKDISQVEIEMIPVVRQNKPVITGFVGDIEEKTKNNLKAVIEDLNIQESPKEEKKEKKFRFNVTVQEFPVTKTINAPKYELKKDNFGVIQIPNRQTPVVTSILKKKQTVQLGNLAEDGKVFKKKEDKPMEVDMKKKLLKSLSEVHVRSIDQPVVQKSGSNDNMTSTFTVTVNRTQSVDKGFIANGERSSSNKLKIVSIEKTLDKGSKTEDNKNTEIKSKDLNTVETEKSSLVELGKKGNVTENDNKQSLDTSKSIPKTKTEISKQDPKEEVNKANVLFNMTKKDLKTDTFLCKTDRQKDNVPKWTERFKREQTKSLEETEQTETKAVPKKSISLDESSSNTFKENTEVTKTQKANTSETSSEKEVSNISKEATIENHNQDSSLKTKLKSLQTNQTNKDEISNVESLPKSSAKLRKEEKSVKVENDNQVDFWGNQNEEKYEPPTLDKLKLAIKDPKSLLSEIQEGHKDFGEQEPETPEEREKRMISKRSLIQKANKSDPDLKVFEPPTPPTPEPVKEPSPEPSFVPLQSNRLSQWMHPWKKPAQREDNTVELYAKPKFIRVRHIPRRWRQNVVEDSQSEDSTTSEEDSSSEESDEESEEESEEEQQIGAESKVGASTSSNDSGFDSGRAKNNGSVDSRDSPGNTLTPALNPAFALDSNDLPEEVCQSSTYQSFQRSGRITPPATTIPRFRKYCVDDFNFLKVLGKGSFGKVLLAELKGTEYYYAIKCLKKDVVLEDDDVECTLIERKVLALGTKHPYLCHLLCTFQTESHLFFVMEYLNGGDLMFHIQVERRFSEARARFYGAEIVSGLKFLHNKGIVYRDLKLDNILLDFDGHVRIADFGMCKLQIFLDRMADTFCGTPDYMAPEIIKGQHYNQCVDWWSFGVLLYEMLLGQSPFSGCDEDELFWSICNEKPVIPRFLSAEASSVLTQFLEKDANKRLGNRFSPHGDIQDHPFFKPIDWEALENRRLEPPFKPNLQHPLDTQYFDKTFTNERAKLTPIETGILQSMDQTQFQGFSYTNPNATDK